MFNDFVLFCGQQAMTSFAFVLLPSNRYFYYILPGHYLPNVLHANRRLSTGRHIISWLCSLKLKQMPVSDNCSCICIRQATCTLPTRLSCPGNHTHRPPRGRDRWAVLANK